MKTRNDKLDSLSNPDDEEVLRNELDDKEINLTLDPEEEEEEDQYDEFGNLLDLDCPFCGSKGYCDHHIVQIDETYPELTAGRLSYDVDEIDKIIKEGLYRIICDDQRELFSKKSAIHYFISDLEGETIEKADDIPIYNSSKVGLVSDILLSISGTDYYDWDNNTAPGYSSSMRDYYAEDADKAIKQFYIKLKALFMPPKRRKK